MNKTIPEATAKASLEHWRFELPETGCLISASAWNEGNGYHYFRGHLHHRAAYVGAHGPIPEGYVIDHTCFNRSCINPDHLRAIPRHENTRRRNGAVFPLGQCRWGHPLSAQREFSRPGKNRKHCGACQDEKNAALAKILTGIFNLELAYGLGGHETSKSYAYRMRIRDQRVAAVRAEIEGKAA
ncbi:MAG TPA: HNH endonuclease signature motif containing protein [Marmoricola sp.]|nr:HNH endonuclease signature motif containing protein [Marmoricola sp.]